MEASVRASATNCPEPRYFTIDGLSAAESPPSSFFAGIEPETTANTIPSNAAIPSVAKTAVSASHAAVPGQYRFFTFRSIKGFARIGIDFCDRTYDELVFKNGTHFVMSCSLLVTIR
jgi:hypothetical protein